MATHRSLARPARAGGPRRRGAELLARAGRHRLLLAILLGALAVRLVYALLIDGAPHRIGSYDGTWYDRVARDLAAGKGVRGVDGQPTAFFPPGYPALLAVAYALFGSSFVVARLLNCVLATLTCFFTYRIGARAYNEAVGLLAAGLFAFFPGDVFYASQTLSEVSFTCALSGCIYVFLVWNAEPRRVSEARWLLFGLLLGWTALIRGLALLYLSVPLAIWLGTRGWGRATLSRGALAALGLVLAVAPWTLRNWAVMGHPILIASDGPNALIIAHSPVANGSQSIESWNFRLREFEQLVGIGNPRSEAEFARADLRYGLRYLLTHPRHELSLVPKRIFHLFRHGHYALEHSTVLGVDKKTGRQRVRVRLPREYRRLARFTDVFFFLLLGFALLGTTRVFSRAARAGLIVPLTPLFFVMAHGILFWGDPRFHAGFVPMLAILAAVAVDGRRRPWTIRRSPIPEASR
jgi:4-amino-4-deoxy-L-arabinose transferase-like glycosyltransferase